MKIERETKYNIGDVLWTDGWKVDCIDEVAVQVTVKAIKVVVNTYTTPLTFYVVSLTNPGEDALEWDMYDLAPSVGYATDTRSEGALFPTKEEAEDYIKNKLPF